MSTNDVEMKCPVASRPESKPLPLGYDKPTELLTNGKRQCPFFMPKTYGNGCADSVCHGSHMMKGDEALGGLELGPEQVWSEAEDYIREYYYENKLLQHQLDERLAEIKKDINEKGWYTQTVDEMSFGVKTAWRNARRCIMRSQWSTMSTIDARHITTPDAMIDACLHHLEVTRNGGRIRPHVTLFPQKKPGMEGPRIWNEQLLRYAGYKMEDGTIIGDPANLEFTAVCLSLGWKPQYTKWDVCPLVVNIEGGDPVWREIPERYIKEIHITHPDYEWFGELGLRWFDHPPVSSFALSIGGIEYTASPFSGWYMSTEIASRDLADEYRYNALPEIGRRMGLPMSNRALWKDRAVLELSTAVLYSWDKAKTTMVDHHSASDSFIAHYEKELKNRGHCPADWVWITPPTSSAQTRVFHQEMYSYLIKPAVLTLFERAWTTYYRRMGIESPYKVNHEVASIEEVSENAITIAYATETGTALQYAERLQKFLLGRRMEVTKELVELDNLDLTAIKHTLIILSSSFGDGEPPANANEFNKIAEEARLQTSCRYAVFGLGSTLYGETYQKFPKFVDEAITKMGGRRVMPINGCDETADPDATFTSWMTSLAVAIEVGTETNAATMEAEMKEAAIAEVKQNYHNLAGFKSIAVTGGRIVYDSTVHGDHRSAYHVEINSTDGNRINYIEGDHMSILPPTKPEDIATIQPFLDAWGTQSVHDTSVHQILTEFVEWSGKAQGTDTPAAQYLLSTSPTAETLAEIFQGLPLKKARHFSISSTPQFNSSTIHVAIARVADGQVSMPLTNAVRSKTIGLFKGCIRQSKFRLPTEAQTPIILVGAGTGVGPLRGMMHGRIAAQAKGSDAAKGSITCIFGFRSADEFFYKDEFADASDRGVYVHAAYSRAGAKSEKITDVILKFTNKIARLLEDGAHFYVCGSTQMGKSVEAALAQVMDTSLGLGPAGSKAYMSTLRKEGRLSVDTYTRVGTY